VVGAKNRHADAPVCRWPAGALDSAQWGMIVAEGVTRGLIEIVVLVTVTNVRTETGEIGTATIEVIETEIADAAISEETVTARMRRAPNRLAERAPAKILHSPSANRRTPLTLKCLTNR
jgi:hypothetical protein